MTSLSRAVKCRDQEDCCPGEGRGYRCATDRSLRTASGVLIGSDFT